MPKFSKIFYKKIITNYKRKSRFFGILILKTMKFRQKFAVETLPENDPSNIIAYKIILQKLACPFIICQRYYAKNKIIPDTICSFH